MALPSHQGGCSATPATIDDVEREVRQDHRSLRENADAFELASEDWNMMSNSVWRMKLWRSYPSWSIPAAALRLLFAPKWVNPKRPAMTAGLGYHQDEFEPPKIMQGLLRAILFLARKRDR
eukprot:1629705-Pyramimonas_sp.AAC.1